jgi:hypothetical protein
MGFIAINNTRILYNRADFSYNFKLLPVTFFQLNIYTLMSFSVNAIYRLCNKTSKCFNRVTAISNFTRHCLVKLENGNKNRNAPRPRMTAYLQ